MQNFLVVGAGFSGAVIARELATRSDCHVLVLDERPHLGGNCHTERDPDTGIMVHRYGPHIFNTNDERVWNYVNRFGKFRPFVNRVKAVTPRGVFSLPINLHTINQLFDTCLGPAEAKNFIAQKADLSIGEPRNFEQQALKHFGREIYETFFYGYTKKQWGCEPRELPPEILKRLPVRFDYNDSYYDKKYQGIPEEGYTEVIRRILDHPNIEVRLGEKFDPTTLQPVQVSSLPPSLPLMSPSGLPSTGYPERAHAPVFNHVFYTGPLDAFFGHSLGRLSYRTVTFERIEADGDYQGNAVINYTDAGVPFTRIHEHKHFAPWESHARTVAFREFSKETGPEDLPFYPKRLSADLTLLQKYRAMGESFSSSPQGFPISFLGRLATYRYMDMERVIAEALDAAQSFEPRTGSLPSFVFPNTEVHKVGGK